MAEIIPHWLTKQASLAPDQIAIETEHGESITFSKLAEKSKCFARKLASLDIGEGSHVGILSTNGIPMVVAIHALSYLGAVVVLLNTRLTKDELAYQMKDAEVLSVLTCDHMSTKAEEMDFNIPIKSFSNIEQLQEKHVKLRNEINLDSIFTIIYTSGTTGFPKGVIH